MKKLKPTPIKPILAVVSSEIVAACELLNDFEYAISQPNPTSSEFKPHLQGFDLAIQILQDIQYLTDVLSQSSFIDTELPYPLQTSDIRLERVRTKLSENLDKLPRTNRKCGIKVIDLF